MKTIPDISLKVMLLGLCVLGVLGWVAYLSSQAAIANHRIDAEINAQKDIERVQIEQKAAIQRTRERMHWIPWYSDGKNEGDDGIGS